MKLRFLVLLTSLSLGIGSALTGATPSESMQIFLLIGQSNMAGRAPVEPSDRVPHPRIYMLDRELAWVPAVDPLHFDKPKIAGVGPGSSFGRAIAEAKPDAVIGLVPAAFGGTSLDEWKSAGALYANAVKRARAAMEHGRLAGILWHQGEADSAPEKASTYATRFAAMIARLRSDLNAPDVPVIVGETGRFRPGAEKINAVLAGLPLTVPHCAFVSAEGLVDKGDKLHFDRASQQELGRRYAAAWQRLENETQPVDPTAKRPLVVLKLDDMRGRNGGVDPRWQRLVDFVRARHLHVGIGVICDSLEGDQPVYFGWLKQLAKAGDIELWDHGYDHRMWSEGGVQRWEFSGPTFEAQREHLEKAQRLGREKIGVTFHAFGAGYNAVDATTSKVLASLPEINVWLYGRHDAAPGVFVADRVAAADMEHPVHRPNYATFVAGFESHRQAPYYVLQGHPPSWDDHSFAEFVRIVDYLSAHQAEFLTPSELAVRLAR